MYMASGVEFISHKHELPCLTLALLVWPALTWVDLM